MFKSLWDAIKKPIMVFMQYTFSFSFPVLCVIVPFILSFVCFNFWLMFLYVITIPAFVTQRHIIEEHKKRNKDFADFWSLSIWDTTEW